MSPRQLLYALEFAEVNKTNPPDCRQVLRREREALSAALRSGDGERISTTSAEAKRVADMWGVKL